MRVDASARSVSAQNGAVRKERLGSVPRRPELLIHVFPVRINKQMTRKTSIPMPKVRAHLDRPVGKLGVKDCAERPPFPGARARRNADCGHEKGGFRRVPRPTAQTRRFLKTIRASFEAPAQDCTSPRCTGGGFSFLPKFLLRFPR